MTSTVRGITQASIPVGFIARGRRKLKGIREPVEVFAVTRDPTAKAPRELPRTVLLGAAGVAVVVLAGVAALAGSLLPGKPAATPSPTAAPSAQPVAIGPLAIGSYASREFQPPLTFDILDQGWAANRDSPEMLGLVRQDAPLGGVYLLRVDQVFANPCVAGDGAQTGPAAADVITELEALDDHLALSDRAPASVGGSTGQQVDVTVSEGSLAACGGLVDSEVPIFGAGEEVWRASPGERFRLVSIDVGGQAVTLLVSADWSELRSIQQLEDLFELGQRVLDSIEF